MTTHFPNDIILKSQFRHVQEFVGSNPTLALILLVVSVWGLLNSFVCFSLNTKRCEVIMENLSKIFTTISVDLVAVGIAPALP